MKSARKSDRLLDKSWMRWTLLGVVSACILVAGWWMYSIKKHKAELENALLVKVEKRVFEHTIRRPATLEPSNKIRVMTEVYGFVVDAAEDGSQVKTGDLLIRIDPRSHQEAMEKQRDHVRKIKAEREKERQAAAKEIFKAKADAESRRLRVDTENIVLKEVMLGPSATDVLNTQAQLENARTLMQAREEEYAILEPLAQKGYVSQSEFRTKKLEKDTQKLNLEGAKIAVSKLMLPPTVAQKEQELKVHVEEKNLAAALEKANLLESNDQRAEQTYLMRLKRETTRLEEFEENITKTTIIAPAPGVVSMRKMRGRSVGPGFETDKNFELLTLADLRRMKAVVSVDEGRVGQLRKGMKANIHVGLSGTGTERTLPALITRVAEKGRDEFEGFASETRDRTGKANRQVFDVDLDIQGEFNDLRPGMRAEAEILVASVPDARIAPEAAVNKENGQAFVWLASASGPEKKMVNVLAEDGLYCSLDGLNEGDRIYLVAP